MKQIMDMKGVPCPGPVVAVKKKTDDMIAGELIVLVDNRAAVQNLEKFAEYKGFSSAWMQKGEKEFEVQILVGPKNLRNVDEYFDVFHENDEDSKTEKPERTPEPAEVREEPAEEEPECETCGLVSPEEILKAAEEPEKEEAQQPVRQEEKKTAGGPIARGTVLVISSDGLGSGDEELGRLLMKGFIYAVTEQDQLPETALFYNRGVYLTVEGSGVLEDLKELERRGVKLLSCGTCLNHFSMLDRLKVGEVTNMYELAGYMMKAERLVRP